MDFPKTSFHENELNGVIHIEQTQLYQKLIHMKSELAKYKAQVEDYENNYHYSQLRKLKQANAKLIEENNSLSIQIDNTTQKMEELLRNYQLQVGKNQQLEKEHNDTSSRLKKDIETLASKNQKFTQVISSLTENQSSLEAINNELKEELLSLKKEMDQKQSLINEIQLKHSNLQKENQKNLAELRDYQTSHQEISLQYENINLEKQQLDTKLAELINSTNVEKQMLEKELESKDTFIEQQRKNIKQLEQQINKLDKENLEQKNKSDGLKKIITKHNEEKLELISNTKQLHEQFNLLKEGNEQIINLILETKNDKDQESVMKKMINSIKDEITALKSGQNEIAENIRKFQNDIETFLPTFELITSADDETMLLIQIETQIKKLIRESFDYEVKLESQYMTLHNLERSLLEMNEELMKIENNKSDDHQF